MIPIILWQIILMSVFIALIEIKRYVSTKTINLMIVFWEKCKKLFFTITHLFSAVIMF